MPIYTESLTKFWGEGSETILEWATDGNEGIFFKRIFGCESQDVSEEEMEKRTDCCRLGDMWCSVKKKEDGSVSLYMNTIRNIPVGAFEKIARQFPKLHADGVFIQQTEEFFGSYVIEKGQFLWTQFHNPGKRSGDPDYRFDSFFESDLEKISDDKQRAVLKVLELERRMLHGEKSAKKELKRLLKEFRDEKNKDANIGFYFSTEEKKALAGDKASQNKLSKDIRNSYYDDKSIYNEDDTERAVFEQDWSLMALAWLKKAAVNGYEAAYLDLLVGYLFKGDFGAAKEWFIAFGTNQWAEIRFIRQLGENEEGDDLIALLKMVCWVDIEEFLDCILQNSDIDVDDIVVEYPYYDGKLSLVEFAAICGAKNCVQLLIEKYNASYIKDNDDEKSLVCLAARSFEEQPGSLDLVKYLVEECGCDTRYVAHWAAREYKFETVKWLIEEAGADINETDKYGKTILHDAVFGYCNSWAETEEDLELVRWLVEKGVDLYCFHNYGNTVLHNAVEYSERSNEIAVIVVKYFIEKCHMDPSIDGGSGTPLTIAARVGNLSIVKYLVHGCGVNPNEPDGKGSLPINYAISNNHFEVVEWLIEEGGADINVAEKGGWTPFLCAAISLCESGCNTEEDLELIRWLVEKGADVNVFTPSTTETLVWTASTKGNTSAIEFLINEYHMDPCCPDEDDLTLISRASYAHQIEFVKFLIKCGVDINIKSAGGRTPLHDAVSGYEYSDDVDLELVKWLVDNGADIYCVDDYGDTVLSTAAFYGNITAAKYFIEECHMDPNFHS